MLSTFILDTNFADCTVDNVTVGENTPLCGKLQQARRFQINSDRTDVTFRTSPRNGPESPKAGKGFSFTVNFLPQSNLQSPSCGRPEVRSPEAGARAKIIGGSTARVGSWPWMAFINGANCGGALVTNR